MATIKEQLLSAFTSLKADLRNPAIDEIILRLDQSDIHFTSDDFSKLPPHELEKIAGLVLVTIEAYPQTLQHGEQLKQLLIKSLQPLDNTPENKFRSTL